MRRRHAGATFRYGPFGIGRRSGENIFCSVGVPNRETLVAVLDLDSVVRYGGDLYAAVGPVLKIECPAFAEQPVIETVRLFVPFSKVEVPRVQFRPLYGIALVIIRRNVVVTVSGGEAVFIQIVESVDLPGDLQLGAQRPAFADTPGKLVGP